MKQQQQYEVVVEVKPTEQEVASVIQWLFEVELVELIWTDVVEVGTEAEVEEVVITAVLFVVENDQEVLEHDHNDINEEIGIDVLTVRIALEVEVEVELVVIEDRELEGLEYNQI